MAIPNLISLIVLSGVVVKLTDSYQEKFVTPERMRRRMKRGKA